MPILPILFYFFASLVVFSGFMTISSRNPVQSILYLVLTFVSSAVLWMMLQAEFLSLILVFVYVGAVMTLFLFVVMMINLEKDQLKKTLIRHLPIALLVVIAMITMIILVIAPNTAGLDLSSSVFAEMPSNIRALGKILYTEYLIPFELAAVLLLIAIIAAISLSHQERVERKTQHINEQLRVRSKDRLTIVSMPTDKEWGKE